MTGDWRKVELELSRIPFDPDRIKSANIVLFGAAMNGAWALHSMLAEGYRVAAFADNYFERFQKCGGGYEGLPVIAPDRLKEIEDVFVVITTTGHLYQDIRNQLTEMGCPHLTHMELMLLSHKKEFHDIFSSYLEDEKSREVYLNILLGHLYGDDRYFKRIYEGSQYFAIPEFDEIMGNEVYADVGAYVGDSVENYIVRKDGVFKKIYAFEPVRGSYCAMNKRIRRLREEWNIEESRIECFSYAVGEKKRKAAISAGKTGASSDHIITAADSVDAEIVEMISLDEFFESREEIPTFIKADIEGGELALLHGAEKLIRHHKPKLALCIYHKDEDLYELPMEVRRLNPAYRFVLRHHKPQFTETVLYCW